MASDLLETFELESRCLIKSSSRIFAKEYVEDGVPFFRSKDVIDKALGVFSGYDLFISRERYEELKKSHGSPSKGDLLISSVGNRSGQPYVVQDEGDFYFKDGNIIWISDFKDIDSNFLAYWFKSNIGQSRLASVMIGSAQKALTINSIRTLTVTFPIFANQKAIAHILGSLDDKIELNRQMNETLEAMAQALFKSWFVDFDLVIDNALAAGNAIPDEFFERAEQRKGIEKKENSDIQNLFPDEFEFTEEMGWIPRGWEVDSVENLIQINPRITLKKGTVAPHADMKALPESGYSIDGVVQKAYSGGTKFENRDVLFARITPCLENGKTGLVDFLKPKEVGFGSTEFIVLREKDDINMEFVACLARNSKFRLHAQQSMVGSSGRQRVQNACFSSFYLALPKDDGKLLKLFNETTAVNFDKTSILTNECQILAKLRDTLLPKLMSGELRINDVAELVGEVL